MIALYQRKGRPGHLGDWPPMGIGLRLRRLVAPVEGTIGHRIPILDVFVDFFGLAHDAQGLGSVAPKRHDDHAGCHQTDNDKKEREVHMTLLSTEI